MSDKRITQLPQGVLTPMSLFPIVTNDVTSRITFNDILAQVNAGGGGSTSVWGGITGDINNQTDLFDMFQLRNSPFVNLGTGNTPSTRNVELSDATPNDILSGGITNIELSAGTNLKVYITGDTFFNIIPVTDGTETNLVIKIPNPLVPTVIFSPNVKWHNKTVQSINNIDGVIDTTFNVGVGTQNSTQVNATYIQPDGKTIIGGSFTTYAGVAQGRIAKLNSDGSIDTSFSGSTIGFDADNATSIGTVIVRNITPLTNGKLLLSGNFLQYNNITLPNIVKLNNDSSIDNSFINLNLDAAIRTVSIQSDNKILIGGDFVTYNVSNMCSVNKINFDGSVDTSFDSGINFNSQGNNGILGIAQQSDNKIILVGRFITYNSVNQNRIVRLNANGTADATYNSITSIGFNNDAATVVIQSGDDKSIIAGNFTTYNGVAQSRIIRLNIDGTKDTTFSGVTTGFDNIVNTSVIQPDGKIILGGQFTTYNGVAQNRIIRLNSDGTKDTTFSGSVITNGIVNSIVLQLDGKILAGGTFTTPPGYFVRLNTDGTKDTTFSGLTTGFSNMSSIGVGGVAIQPDGKILVGGDYTQFNGVAQPSITRLNTNGSKDTTFSGVTSATSILSVKVLPDTKIIIEGYFTTYNGVSQSRIAKLNPDGSLDVSFSGTALFGFNGTIYSSLISNDGKLFSVGMFYKYGGTPLNNFNYFIRLNSDGSRDATFSGSTSGFNQPVYSSVIQSDGKILVGGKFTTYNGLTQNRITRLNTDGSIDVTYSGTPSIGFDSDVNAIIIDSNNKAIIGGQFTTYNGITKNRIVKLNTDGSVDTTFTTGTGLDNPVNVFSFQTDGKLLVGGKFSSYNNAASNNIVRLNTDGSKDLTFVTKIFSNSSNVFGISNFNNKIVVGGDFTTYDAITQNGIFKLRYGEENNYYFKLVQEGNNIIIK